MPIFHPPWAPEVTFMHRSSSGGLTHGNCCLVVLVVRTRVTGYRTARLWPVCNCRAWVIAFEGHGPLNASAVWAEKSPLAVQLEDEVDIPVWSLNSK